MRKLRNVDFPDPDEPIIAVNVPFHVFYFQIKSQGHNFFQRSAKKRSWVTFSGNIIQNLMIAIGCGYSQILPADVDARTERSLYVGVIFSKKLNG